MNCPSMPTRRNGLFIEIGEQIQQDTCFCGAIFLKEGETFSSEVFTISKQAACPVVDWEKDS